MKLTKTASRRIITISEVLEREVDNRDTVVFEKRYPSLCNTQMAIFFLLRKAKCIAEQI
jgi:hypothetical protein